MLYVMAVLVLAVILVFAFNNRFLERELYGPKLGHLPAHYVGVLLQVLFIAVVTCLLLNWLRGAYARADLWAIGVLWAVLGTACELWFYRAVMRREWREMLAEYNPLTGHAWLLVPLALLLTPLVVGGWLPPLR